MCINLYQGQMQKPDCILIGENGNIQSRKENILAEFIKTDALLAEYARIAEDPGNDLHRIRSITEAVQDCGTSAVTVTVKFFFDSFFFQEKGISNTKKQLIALPRMRCAGPPLLWRPRPRRR